MITEEEVIEQTKRWINDVVVGCNFCPFAAKVVKQQAVFYKVENSDDAAVCLAALLNEAIRLDDETTVETSFLIFPQSFEDFEDYLDLVAAAEDMLIEKGYEGIYQLASFHPLYMFADASEKDAANYTNRSIYPMLHLLRESSIDTALENYKDPENIPGDNIDFARKKGLLYMKMLRDACM
jgi:uncharacterized protein